MDLQEYGTEADTVMRAFCRTLDINRSLVHLKYKSGEEKKRTKEIIYVVM